MLTATTQKNYDNFHKSTKYLQQYDSDLQLLYILHDDNYCIPLKYLNNLFDDSFGTEQKYGFPAAEKPLCCG